MNCLEANLAALDKVDSRLARDLRILTPDTGMQILPTRTAACSARIGEATIHSLVDPKKEARRLVDAQSKRGTEFGVFFGFGLGHLVEAFLEGGDASAVVVEPVPARLRKVLESVPLQGLLANPRLRVLLGEADLELLELLRKHERHEVLVFRYPPLARVSAEAYARFQRTIKRFFSRREINSNTLRRFGKVWVRNLARNSRLLWTSCGVELLRGGLQGFPALVLAAGPSLDEVLPHLLELAKRCVVISVDTAIPVCGRVGLTPDFAVVVDPQYWNTRHLDRQTLRGSLMVSESATHPRAFRAEPDRLFLAGSFFPLGTYLETYAGSKGKLGAGGSVATSAWDLARILGTGPIIMAGLDLGFPGNQTHVRGSFFEELATATGNRVRPSELTSYRMLFDAEPRYVPANDGGLVLSDRRMQLYGWWFEAQVRLHPTTSTWTLARRGAAIPGIPLVPIEEAMTLPASRERIRDALRRLPEITRETAPRSFEKAVVELRRGMQDLAGLAEQALVVVRTARKTERAGEMPDLDRLRAIDDAVRASPLRNIAGFLLEDVSERVKDAAPADAAGLLDTSELLYEGLRDAAAYHNEIFLKFPDRLPNLVGEGV